MRMYNVIIYVLLLFKIGCVRYSYKQLLLYCQYWVVIESLIKVLLRWNCGGLLLFNFIDENKIILKFMLIIILEEIV